MVASPRAREAEEGTSFSEKWLVSEVVGGPGKSTDLPGNHELPRWEEVLFGFTWRKTTHRGRVTARVTARWGCQGRAALRSALSATELRAHSLTELL